MNVAHTLKGADFLNLEGMANVFRFALAQRENEADLEALKQTEKRFGLGKYISTLPGTLKDVSRHLASLDRASHFETVLDLINTVSNDIKWPDNSIADDLAKRGSAVPIVRFSFEPAILPCLLCADISRRTQITARDRYAIRYAGVGHDVRMMAFAAIYLDLPFFTEVNPPWDPDVLFEDNEPNTDAPDLEISFPPTDFRAAQAPHFEKSVRNSKLPRAVDRGKLDIESVMLQYLGRAPSSAIAFVSDKFIASTKQSYLFTRQKLINERRISRVTEIDGIVLLGPATGRFVIELDDFENEQETILMAQATDARQLGHVDFEKDALRGKLQKVSIDQIQSAGNTLKPTRFISTGRVGGENISTLFKNIRTPTTYKLADLFEIIRPKTSKSDPVGDLKIQEIRGGDISEFGELLKSSKAVHIRSTLKSNFENQMLKFQDIVFAHRGPIGRVAYITEANIESSDRWASQSLVIIRQRNWTSAETRPPYCDPRVLFMYLMTQEIRDSWADIAIGDRSPAIPIGEIERFGLPENLLLQRKPKTSGPKHDAGIAEDHTALILAEFDARQIKLSQLRELETSMNVGLHGVWKTAWQG